MRRLRKYLTRWKLIDLGGMAVLLIAVSRLVAWVNGDPHPWFGLGRPMAISTAVCLIIVSISMILIAAWMEQD